MDQGLTFWLLPSLSKLNWGAGLYSWGSGCKLGWCNPIFDFDISENILVFDIVVFLISRNKGRSSFITFIIIQKKSVLCEKKVEWARLYPAIGSHVNIPQTRSDVPKGLKIYLKIWKGYRRLLRSPTNKIQNYRQKVCMNHCIRLKICIWLN